jgi:hypothetical protein
VSSLLVEKLQGYSPTPRYKLQALLPVKVFCFAGRDTRALRRSTRWKSRRVTKRTLRYKSLIK